jgi:dTDP-glucose 4,6-dehydratase
MKKILVIGSNSFSGSDFIDLLLDDHGNEVIGLSRSPEKTALFLPYQKRKAANFKFFQLDLNTQMPRILDLADDFKPEWIVNFATQSEVAPSWENPEHWFQTNGASFAALAGHLRKQNYLKRYLHISTPEVYGSCRGSVSEDAPLNPSTPYAVSRAAQDMLLKIFHQRFGFPVVSVRSANVYGACQQLWKIIPRTVVYLKLGRRIELHGGGLASRSFIHIRDVSRGELSALGKGTIGEIYHLATEKYHTIAEVVKLVCDAMHRDFAASTVSVGDRPGQDSAYTLSIQKAKKDLGWEPQIALREGILQVMEWVERNWDEIKNAPLEYAHKP